MRISGHLETRVREKKGKHFIETLSNVLSNYLDFFVLAFFHLEGEEEREERGSGEESKRGVAQFKEGYSEESM